MLHPVTHRQPTQINFGAQKEDNYEKMSEEIFNELSPNEQ